MATVVAGALLGGALYRALSAGGMEELGVDEPQEQLVSEQQLQQPIPLEIDAMHVTHDPLPAPVRAPTLLPMATGWEPPEMVATLSDLDSEYKDFMSALLIAEKKRSTEMVERVRRMEKAAETSEFERQRRIFEGPALPNREPPTCEPAGLRGPGWLSPRAHGRRCWCVERDSVWQVPAQV